MTATHKVTSDSDETRRDETRPGGFSFLQREALTCSRFLYQGLFQSTNYHGFSNRVPVEWIHLSLRCPVSLWMKTDWNLDWLTKNFILIRCYLN